MYVFRFLWKNSTFGHNVPETFDHTNDFDVDLLAHHESACHVPPECSASMANYILRTPTIPNFYIVAFLFFLYCSEFVTLLLKTEVFFWTFVLKWVVFWRKEGQQHIWQCSSNAHTWFTSSVDVFESAVSDRRFVQTICTVRQACLSFYSSF